MEYVASCSRCARETQNLLDYKCLCGQPLTVHLERVFQVEKIRTEDHTVWRYSKFFPYVKEREIITLGEGWTPLVKLSANSYFKLENLNPTGSFKDRGSTVLFSALHNALRRTGGFVSEDSSGNAGASMAAYAGRSGLKARIYVPEKVSGPKFSQIRFYGAQVVKVSGSRSKVAEEAQKSEGGKFYVGHILHPLFRDGIRTLAYEIAEQLGWHVPQRVYLPVSAGTLIVGVMRGFTHLAKSDVIESTPKIVACQTRQVSPLYHQFRNLRYTPPSEITSIADALVSTNPPLIHLMAENLRETNGEVVIVEEDQILLAFKELAKMGFLVEPSSAVAYAAYKDQLKKGEASRDDRTVIILTGMGLKTMLKPC